MKLPHGLAAALFGSAAVVALVQTQSAFALSATQVNAIARQVTVQIDGQNPGSGVIIAKQGQTYYVLTAAHVVQTEDEYEIVTPDGKKYPINYKLVRKFPDKVDLAIVQFNSPLNYQLVAMGRSSQLKPDVPAYVAGFPQAPESRTTNVYRFAEGEIVAFATRPVGNGYALAYYNDTFSGMSGGPILNQEGQLIGIHGASRTAFADNQGFDPRSGVKFGLNLGIPVETFLRGVPQVTTVLKFPTVQVQPVTAQPTASDFYIRGVELAIAGDRKAALAEFAQAIRLQPDYSVAYLQRGTMHFGLGERQAALTDFDQAIRLKPKFVNAHIARAVTYIRLGNLKAAIENLDQALRLDPNSVPAYGNRAFVRINLKEIQGALMDANQALRLNPSNANVFNTRAAIYLILKELPKAQADANQALKLDPNFADAYNTRGGVRRALQDFPGAIADFDQAIRLNPSYVEAWDNRGLTRIKDLQDYPGGIADYNQSLRLNPKNPSAYLNRGFARFFMGDRQGAIADFQQSAELAKSQGNSQVYESAMQNLRRLQP